MRAHGLAPLGGVAQHDAAAGFVEAPDAVGQDVAPRLELQLLFHLVLDGQAVAVPAEAPFDAETAHGAVARHDVLDGAGQEMAVVRQAGRERRPVVEHELGRSGTQIDRALERVVAFPDGVDLGFECGEIDLVRSLAECHAFPLGFASRCGDGSGRHHSRIGRREGRPAGQGRREHQLAGRGDAVGTQLHEVHAARHRAAARIAAVPDAHVLAGGDCGRFDLLQAAGRARRTRRVRCGTSRPTA
jgi:hypothetical protein